MFSWFSALLVTLLLCFSHSRAEVIYDNTQFLLAGYATETREYGDQVDLEGTARTLTEITFYYYGDFISDGDEGMKVRVYSNETPYDRYRNAPTKLLYESGTMPLKQGYNARSIENLNVKLPGNSVTVTVEFKGLATNEVAGLLLYSPPTVGSSFNEFWRRNTADTWAPFIYSLTDPDQKANAGLRLVARPDPVISTTQTNTQTAVTLRSFTKNFRIAQTFRAEQSGKLDHATIALDSTGAPVQLSIFDTSDGKPGTNLLATQLVQPSASGTADAGFYSESIYLKAGTLYALQVEAPNSPPDNSEERVLGSFSDDYKPGKLWVQADEEGAPWREADVSPAPEKLDAAFSISIVPSDPPVRIVSPSPGAVIPYGRKVMITIETNLPAISTIFRARFYDGNQELEQVRTPPYQTEWIATNSGPHTLRVVVEDTFGRPFRAESHTVTVLDAPPVPEERRATVLKADQGAIILRFGTKPGEKIRVQYSEDLEHWKPANGDLVGTGEELDYTDDGPPKTEQHPKDVFQRYYRIIFGE